MHHCFAGVTVLRMLMHGTGSGRGARTFLLGYKHERATSWRHLLVFDQQRCPVRASHRGSIAAVLASSLGTMAPRRASAAWHAGLRPHLVDAEPVSRPWRTLFPVRRECHAGYLGNHKLGKRGHADFGAYGLEFSDDTEHAHFRRCVPTTTVAHPRAGRLTMNASSWSPLASCPWPSSSPAASARRCSSRVASLTGSSCDGTSRSVSASAGTYELRPRRLAFSCQTSTCWTQVLLSEADCAFRSGL